MPLRVLLVCQYFWPENFRINDVAAELVARGHQVTVLCGTPNYPMGKFFDGYSWFKRTREIWRGVEIVRVPVVPRGKGGKLLLLLNFLSFVLSGVLLGPVRCRGKYDLVMVYQLSPATMGIPALLLRAIKRVPMVFWVQDLWPESVAATGATRNKTLLKIVDCLVKALYKRARLIFIQSRAFHLHVVRRGVSADKVRYLPSSAESLYEPLDYSLAHQALASIPVGTRIMFAGNIGAAQDFGTILSAAELTRNSKDLIWLIAGDGRMRFWVEQEIRRRQLDETVRLLGHFPVVEMPRLFAGVDGLLVTLKKEAIFALTIPAKIQSYLACAKPVISAIDGEGAAILRESGAGLCGPAENPTALAELALEFARMPAERRAVMGRKGLEYFNQNFKLDRHVNRLEGFLFEAVGHGRNFGSGNEESI